MVHIRIGRLGLATIKGTRHLRRDRLTLDSDGPVGDRVFCLVDVDRARVLRTVENPTLVAVEADHTEGQLTCRFPDGSEITGPLPAGEDDLDPRTENRLTADYWGRQAALHLIDGPWSAAFSAYLDRPVRLARATGRGAVVYGAAVTVVTTATLDRIDRKLPGPSSGPDADESTEDADRLAARFRSTVVLDAAGLEADAELGWPGRRLRLGTAVLRLNAPVPRCAVIDLDPVTGSKNRAVMRAAGARPGHEPVVGVDAVVVQPGVVRSGDPAELID